MLSNYHPNVRAEPEHFYRVYGYKIEEALGFIPTKEQIEKLYDAMTNPLKRPHCKKWEPRCRAIIKDPETDSITGEIYYLRCPYNTCVSSKFCGHHMSSQPMGTYDCPSPYALDKLARKTAKAEKVKKVDYQCQGLKTSLYKAYNTEGRIEVYARLTPCLCKTTGDNQLCATHTSHKNGVVGNTSIEGVKNIRRLLHREFKGSELQDQLLNAERFLRLEADEQHTKLKADGIKDTTLGSHLSIDGALETKLRILLSNKYVRKPAQPIATSAGALFSLFSDRRY
jgi:hypothetical protein